MAKRICSTDVRVTKHIYRSWQSVNLEKHRPYADRALSIVRTALPILQQHLDLPKELKVRLASIAGKVAGIYINPSKLVMVDYMFSGRTFLEFLCHELVHAEQYNRSRLEDRQERDGGWVSLWDGYPVKAAYLNRPWEIDAYERQSELADYVIRKAGNTEFMALKI